MSILQRPGWNNYMLTEMADAKRFGLANKQKNVTQGTAYRVVRMILADFLKAKGLISKDARTVTAAEVNNIIASLDDEAITQSIVDEWDNFANGQLGGNSTPEVKQEIQSAAQEMETAAQGQLATGAREAGGHTSSFIQDMQDSVKDVQAFIAATQFPKGFKHMEPSGMGMDTSHQYMKQMGGGKAVRVLSQTPLRSMADLRNSQIVFQDGSEEYNITFDQNGKAASQSVLYTQDESEETNTDCGCQPGEDCECVYTKYSSDVMPESHKLSLRKQTLLAEQARIKRYQHLMNVERRYM